MSAAQAWMDGNEAVAHVAYRLNEVIGIYPITPASAMGSWQMPGPLKVGPISGGRCPRWWRCKAKGVSPAWCMGPCRPGP